MGDGPAAVLVDASGNVVDVLNDGGTFRLQVESKAAAGGAVGKVAIVDSADTLEAGITPDGRLKVEVSPPVAPPSTTAVSDEEIGTISSPNFQNFAIPVGQTLVVQRFLAGSDGEGEKGAYVELRYDQTGGDPIQDQVIARLWVKSASAEADVNFTAPRPAEAGDRIRIRREPLEGSTQRIFGRWEGYHFL